jgi:integrase
MAGSRELRTPGVQAAFSSTIPRWLATDDWSKAAEERDKIEKRLSMPVRLGREQGGVLFSKAAASYLKEEQSRGEGQRPLSAGELYELRRFLGDKVRRRDGTSKQGELLAYFGDYPLSQFDHDLLQQWWDAEVIGAGLTIKTGRNKLNIVAAVSRFAVKRGWIKSDPVPAFRATLSTGSRRRSARKERKSKINPLMPGDVDALLAATAERGRSRHLLTLILLDAGLRLGETVALEWSDVHWGKSHHALSAALHVNKSLSGGRYLGPPKNGEDRVVLLSKRLRAALREAWMEAGRPESGIVCPNEEGGYIDGSNYRDRFFKPACRDAEIVGHTPKGLRDTFGSLLVSVGVNLGWVSKQLGHQDEVVTAGH